MYEFKINMTNEILKYYIKKDLKAKINISPRTIEEDGDNAPQIQIDLDFDGKCNFAIFYDLKEAYWYYSSMYLLENPITKDEADVFEKAFRLDEGIFKDIIYVDDSNGKVNEIHLFKLLENKDFSIALLEEIYNFFNNKNEFIKILTTISKGE